MATIRTYDKADEFRVEIVGNFAGEPVEEVGATWKRTLQSLSRKFTVDISRLTGYDSAGRKLLRQMYRHGTQFAATTPRSLVFLSEIAASRTHHLAAVSEMSAPDVKQPAGKKEANVVSFPAARAAAGGK